MISCLRQRLDARDLKHVTLNLSYDLHAEVVLLLGLFEVGYGLLVACAIERQELLVVSEDAVAAFLSVGHEGTLLRVRVDRNDPACQ